MALSGHNSPSLPLSFEFSFLLAARSAMKSMYMELHALNGELIGEYTKRANNHQELLNSLKDVNLMIQKASKLRGMTSCCCCSSGMPLHASLLLLLLLLYSGGSKDCRSECLPCCYSEQQLAIAVSYHFQRQTRTRQRHAEGRWRCRSRRRRGVVMDFC